MTHSLTQRPADAAATDAQSTIKDQVIDLVRTMVFDGTFRMGDRVEPDSLARLLGASRVPVREGLIVLEHRGLLRTIPRRGTFIRDLTEIDIELQFEMWARIAGLASRNSTVAFSDADIDELARIADELGRATSDEDFYDLNVRFYSAINNTGSSNGLRRELRRVVRSFPAWLYSASSELIDHRGGTGAVQRGVVAALRTRNPDLVEERIRSGILDLGTYVVARLRASGFWNP